MDTDTGRITPGGIRRAWVAYLAYTLGFQRMANLPIERDLYLEVAARFWMQSDVIAGFLMGVGCSHLARVSGAVEANDDASAKDERDVEIGRRIRVRRERRGDARAPLPPPGLRLLTPSASTERAALVVSLAVVFARVASNYAPRLIENFTFSRFGRETLRPLPRDAKLLVKGDVITNSARYVQRCEGYRRDVQMVDMAMLTYEWFVPAEAAQRPRVRVSGARYLHGEPGGFSMRELLDANFRADPDAPVFLAGGWHEHDPSHEGHYDLEPCGVADRVVRATADDDFAARFADERRAAPRVAFWAKLAEVDERDNGYAPGRWERVVVRTSTPRTIRSRTRCWWALESRRRGPGAAAAVAAEGGEGSRVGVRQVRGDHRRARRGACRPVPSFYHRNLGICRQRLWQATGDDAQDRASAHGRV